jgi:DNA-binding MarR family transcriptional regulator
MDVDAPTEREARILEFLSRPATQAEIAEAFGLGKSRRSEVVLSLLRKGLIRSFRLKDHVPGYVRADIQNEELKALLLERPDAALADEEKVLSLLASPQYRRTLVEHMGVETHVIKEMLKRLVRQGRVRRLQLGSRVKYVRDFTDGEPVTFKDQERRHSSVQARVAEFIKSADKAMSNQAIAQGIGVGHRHVFDALKLLVRNGSVLKLQLSSRRFLYVHRDAPREMIEGIEAQRAAKEALEAKPRWKPKPPKPGRLGRDPYAPTPYERTILEFLWHPATQSEIGVKFGLRKNRTSAILVSLQGKGLVKVCGRLDRWKLYVRADAPDHVGGDGARNAHGSRPST